MPNRVQNDISASTRLWIAAGLLVVTLAVYGNSFPGAFILDDVPIAQENSLVKQIDLPKIWTSDYWGDGANSGLYRPLMILSLGVNRALFGSGAEGFHAVNVTLHGLVTLLLFLTLPRYGWTWHISAVAAALFAVHPIHTEVLNEVVGRSELLAGCGLLGALWFAACQRPWLTLTGAAFCFAGALLAKESGIVLLGILPVLDWLAGASLRVIWRERWPLYLLLLVVAGGWLMWRAWGVVHPIPLDIVEEMYSPLYYLAPLSRVVAALRVQWLYLGKLIWPVGLQGVYSGSYVLPPGGLSQTTLLLVMAATVVFAGVIIWACRRGMRAGGVLVLYAVSFSVTSNLFFPAGVSMAERLAYFPSVWFCLLAAEVLSAIPVRLPVLVLTAAAIAALSAATWQRNPYYISEQVLWQADVERDPGNILAWAFLAQSYKAAGQLTKADSVFNEKVLPVMLSRDQLGSYSGYFYDIGRHDEAIELGLRFETRVSRPVASNQMVLGKAYLAKGEYREALRWLESCRDEYAEYAHYWEVRGEVLEGLNRLDDALSCYRRALDLDRNAKLPLRLVNLLLRLRMATEAETVLRRYLQEQVNPEAWNALGVALAMQGRLQLAAEAFLEAVKLAPGTEKYLENYRRTLGPAGQ